MNTLTPKKRRDKEKIPEIRRFKLLLKETGIKPVDIAGVSGISERTISRFIWDNTPLSGRLLRLMNTQYGVSIDWLVSGVGAMFINNVSGSPADGTATDARAQRMNRFIAHWMATASSDEKAWLETQFKLNVPQYESFLYEEKHDDE